MGDRQEPTLRRFAVGAAALGADELRRSSVRTGPPGGERPVQPGLVVPPHVIVPRWVAIGLIFEAPLLAREAMTALEPTAKRVGKGVRRLAGPLWRSRLAAPLRQRVAHVREDVTARLLALSDRGWLEERRARELALSTSRDLSERAIGRIASATEIREVLVDQGASLAEEVIGVAHEEAAQADDRLEQWLRGLFHHRRRSGGRPLPSLRPSRGHA